MDCRICGNSNGIFHVASEMMYGTDEQFCYFECSSCGCIQIESYPADMTQYYESDYYSFKNIVAERGGKIAFWLRKKWVDFGLGQKTVAGRFMALRRPVPELYSIYKKYDISRKSRILDVGCGNGRFLCNLYRAGFDSLTGVDPFIKSDIIISDGFKILKQDIFAVEEKFNCITFNHSFEHLKEQRSVLLKAASLLAIDGIISIAIPVTSFAWRKYKVNWVQLDAPRHFYIHSRKSIDVLAGQTGMKVVETIYNSGEFQFWGSEQYVKGIPLTAKNSRWVNSDSPLFSSSQIEEFKSLAEKLNIDCDGDQAIFLLKHQDNK